MVTIDDVAKIAKVSKATVSKVMNNYRGVNYKTRERVIKAMKQCNYWPNATARSLVTSRSYIVGLFIASRLNDMFFREVLDGIEATLGPLGYDILYLSDKSSVNTGSRFGYVEKVRARHVDGVIFLSYLKNRIGEFEEILSTDIPSVFVDVDIVGKRSSYVISDNVKSGFLAVNYLVKLGHRKIGLIDGTHVSTPAQDRLTGFQRALAEKGIAYNPDWVFRRSYGEEQGYRAMQEILAMPDRPTALIAPDVMALGAIQALDEAGLRVPEDISIVGLDDTEVSRHLGLTAVRQDKAEMGKAASELLIKIIQGEPFAPVTIDTKLIERRSCRPLNSGRGGTVHAV